MMSANTAATIAFLTQPEAPAARLRVTLPGTGWQATTLSFSESVLIGRDESCDLRLDDHRVCRRHAELYRVGSLWWVRDLGSLDGTYLGDECVDAAPVLGVTELKLGVGGPTLRLEPTGECLTAVN
jgi:FHA domain